MFILYCIIYNTILIWLVFASTLGASTVTLTEKVTPERLTTAENMTIPILTTETDFTSDATTTTVEDMSTATAETKTVKSKIENITISMDLESFGNTTATPLSKTEEIEKIITEIITSTSTTEDTTTPPAEIKSIDKTTIEIKSPILETETDFRPNTTATVKTSLAETKLINITVDNITTSLEPHRTTGNMTTTPLSETEEVGKTIVEMITSTTTVEDNMTTPSADIKSVDNTTAEMTSPISETVINFRSKTTTSGEDMETSPTETKAINISIIYVVTTPIEKLIKRNKSTTIDDPNILKKQKSINNASTKIPTAESPKKLDATIVLEVVIGTIMLPILVVICIIFYIYWRCIRQGSYTVNEIDESIEEGQEAESLL